MIELGDACREMDPDMPLAPGGFAWWYVDLISPEGDGLVLIWSYGLPFLPGYASGARRGRAQLPCERPSVNLAVYEHGREVFYLLQEYGSGTGEETDGREPEQLIRSAPPPPSSREADIGPPSVGEARCAVLPLELQATREPDCTAERESGSGNAGSLPTSDFRLPTSPVGVHRIGDCRFESGVEDGQRIVEARLDCPLPAGAGRLRGTVRLRGVARRSEPGCHATQRSLHVWTPLTGPALAEAELDWGRRPLARLHGRGYHDRNGGRVPLHALGIRRWMWGRVPLAGRELIYYLLWPKDAGEPPRLLGLTIDEVGGTQRMTDLEVELGRERRGFWGIRWPESHLLRARGRPWASIRHVVEVDNGPFYHRFQSQVTTGEGESALGWSELCEPDRVDRAWHRPLVRMRVHQQAAPNSLWLPLFAGPRAGRLGRWARGLLSQRSG